jgi:hypothetical protein
MRKKMVCRIFGGPANWNLFFDVRVLDKPGFHTQQMHDDLSTGEDECWQNASVVIRAPDELTRAAGLNKSLPPTPDLAVAGRIY